MENIIKQLWSGEACEAGEMAGMLNDLVAEGAHLRYGESLPKAVSERIVQEMSDVTKNERTVVYFLQCWHYVRTAREELHVHFGPGHGSMACSMLNYCLHITEIDPLRFNLPWSRYSLSTLQRELSVEKGGEEKLREWEMKRLGCETQFVFSELLPLNQLDMTQPLPLNDRAALDQFKNGVWMFKDRYSKYALQQLESITFDTIVDVYAMVHPDRLGKLGEYILRWALGAKARYPIAEMGAVMDETFGLLIYQEQVLRLLELLAGIYGDEARALRIALHRNGDLQSYENRFIESGLKKGYEESGLEAVWKRIVSEEPTLAMKSHTICQTMVAYYTAYNAVYEGRIVLK